MKREFIQISLLLICTCTPLIAGVGEDISNSKIPPDVDTPIVIKTPDRIEVQPTKVINTSETQIETVIVDHIREHHVTQGHPPVYVDRYVVRKHNN